MDPNSEDRYDDPTPGDLLPTPLAVVELEPDEQVETNGGYECPWHWIFRYSIDQP